MKAKGNPELASFARDLRNNMTKEESKLWYQFLRRYPVRFLRQKIIGHYIVDFYCAKARLVIEVDGSQHYEDQGRIYDHERTVYIASFGFVVLRIPNNAIRFNFQSVCAQIDSVVQGLMELS